MRFHRIWALLASSSLLSFVQAAVVTTPAGVFTNPGGSNAGDGIAADTWLRVNVRNGGAVGIANTYPRNGDGSVLLSLGANTSNNAKADWEFYPTATFGSLSALTSLSYEWYRDGSSSVPALLHPVIRLLIDADGNLTTTNDRGYLVFERCYNIAGCPAVPTNVWTTESISGATNLWWTQFGVGIDEVYNRTLSAYQSGGYAPSAGFAQITGNSVILGVSLGVGSGWNTAAQPAFLGAVDNVNVTSASPGATSLANTNFEVVAPAPAAAAAVPSLPLFASALLALLVLLAALRGRRPAA